MERINQLKTMFNMQQKLNDESNGNNWESGIAENGKIINWRRCIYLECAELIESYPWKHWKSIDQKPDLENIKIELVDIWHFVMSELLSEYHESDMSLDEILHIIETSVEYNQFIDPDVEYDDDIYVQIEYVEKLIETVFNARFPSKISDMFFNVALHLNMDMDTLFSLYVGKNVLNKFRQDNGYASGTYIKMWNGVEDNVVLQDILSSTDLIGFDYVYNELEKRYSELNN